MKLKEKMRRLIAWIQGVEVEVEESKEEEKVVKKEPTVIAMPVAVVEVKKDRPRERDKQYRNVERLERLRLAMRGLKEKGEENGENFANLMKEFIRRGGSV